jgi:MFS family permease
MKNTLVLLSLSTLVSVCGFAGVQPLAIILMEEQGLGPALIGLLSALIFGGVLIVAPFQPALAARFGAMRTYQAGKLLAVVGFVGCSAAATPWGWAGAFLVLGFAGALTWPLTDSLIATEAPAEKKGAWLGRFQAGMGIAFALGPLVAAGLTRAPKFVFFGAAILAALSSLPLLGRGLPVPMEADEDDASRWQVWRSAAGLGVIALLGGLFENGTHTVGTLVALTEGWSGAAAVALAGVMAVGSFLIHGPIGRAADRRGTRGVLLWALAVLAVSLAMLPLASRGQWILWPLALVWGGASGCLYTLAMTGAAQSFAARQVAMVTTLMVLGYTVGSTLGPVLGGIAVEASPLAGVVWIFGTLSVVGWFMAFRQKPARSWDGQH